MKQYAITANACSRDARWNCSLTSATCCPSTKYRALSFVHIVRK